MNLKLISCKVMARELGLLSANSRNYIDITTIRQGLHDQPSLLQEVLQKEIDKVESDEDFHTGKPYGNQDFDAILIGYGLCSNGITGLSSKKYPLVIPRAHDCIALFLGSKERYKDYFDNHNGIYWYNPGWIENALMPGEDRHNLLLKAYTEQYGEDNAEYLLEMDELSYSKYENCFFIEWPELNSSYANDYARKCAKFMDWNFTEVKGDSSLLKDFVEGNWDDDRFLVVQPGKVIEPSYDDKIIKVR